jgi:general secretion pathway protein M
MDNKITLLKEQAHQRLVSSETYKKSYSWYQALPPRDALVLKVLAVLMALALIYAWLIQPTIENIKQAESKLATELKFHQKLKQNAYLVKGSSSATLDNKGSILSRVNSLAKVKGITLKRFEPNGKTGLRVWLEKVSFDSSIDWIETLETQKGIKVEQISIDKVQPGIVNLRAVLKL